MASTQSAAIVELYGRWLTVPAASRERRPQDNRLSMGDADATADLVDRPQPKLAA
jgi:hypothetical protein